MKTVRTLLFLGLAALSLPGVGRTIRTLGELRTTIRNSGREGQAFEVEGTVRSYHPNFFGAWMYSLSDGTNAWTVSEHSVPGKVRPDPPAFGLLDRIRASGRLTVVEDQLRAVFDSAELISRGDPLGLPLLDSEGLSKTPGGQFVRLRGRVRDAVRDDTDATFILMSLHDERGFTHLMVLEPPQFPADFESLIGAEVIATGSCNNGNIGLHRHFGPHLNVSGLGNIKVVTAPDTFSSAPDLLSLSNATPRRIATTGLHQTSGRVLAVWCRNAFLLRTPDGRLVRVRQRTDTTPCFGDTVRVLGLPATDSLHLNLVHAIWEDAPGGDWTEDTPVDTRVTDMTTSKRGFPQLKMPYYGKTIRLTGTVRYLPDAARPSDTIQLESDGRIIAVDASALPDSLATIEVGCRLSITGVCVMDLGEADPESGSRTDGKLFLVPRTPDDIVVLSRPPWWTFRRLLVLLVIVAAVLLVVLCWNVSLNRRARAKGRELAAEQLAHMTSELKVSERTRLAVELHDALSQTLTGVSMQIDTAAGFADGKLPAVSRCLALASRTIDACRMELRNTLWDLRSAALDEQSMDAAIRKTLCQNLSGVELSVRFCVPREAFSDNTAHAVLKIIRELATNALRHGKASSLKIAGALEDDKLLFSVRDNGCGFDPDLAPGIGEGHFGLQGIAERLERLDGEMKIDSAPGKGTKVTVSLPVPRSGE